MSTARHHHTKSTVSAQYHRKRRGKATMHRIDAKCAMCEDTGEITLAIFDTHIEVARCPNCAAKAKKDTLNLDAGRDDER